MLSVACDNVDGGMKKEFDLEGIIDSGKVGSGSKGRLLWLD